jgi:hypothetical protein
LLLASLSRGWLFLAAHIFWMGCAGSGDGTGLQDPALRIRTATSGVELDPNGYSVAIDGETGRPIGVNASLEIGSLEDGAHTIELLDVSPNCNVGGTHPRTVQTASGSTADVDFAVECLPLIGSVRIIASTTGSARDDDGYVVVVNGEPRQIAANGSLTFEEVTAGPGVAEILGVAANCSAATKTYYDISVRGGETIDVTFAFECSSPQPGTGSLQVAVATSGPGTDPDGYLVAVDGGQATPIGTSASVLLTGLPVGTRTVALSGVAANCAVSGDNPRQAAVSGTELDLVAFAVICTQSPGSNGTVRVSTTSAGPDQDPNGYSVRIDGGAAQPIGTEATISIAGVASGSHSVTLDGLSLNCTPALNPQTVTVSSGGRADVAFAVTCIPAFGIIATSTVTTGESIDVDGYIARVNGGAGKPVPANGTVLRGGLAPGSHTVQLDNVAGNCQVQGDNPRAAIVSGNETIAVAFQVICTATSGSLNIQVAGLPVGTDASISITGPANFAGIMNATGTLGGLSPGEYTIVAGNVIVGADTYRPSAERQVVELSAGGELDLAVFYSREPGSTFNLRIAGIYLTQGSQTPDGTVPLVEGRDGFLRVFVLASGDNDVNPTVRVRLYHNGTEVQTLQVVRPGGTTPTVLQEQLLGESWNVSLPGPLIKRGLAIQADVDPTGSVAESDESDNGFPLNGLPADMAVRPASVFAVRVMPVQLGSGGLIGDVTPGNLSRYLDLTQGMYPLPGVDAEWRDVFTTSLTPAQAGSVNAALSTALSEVRALRTIEGSQRSYFGVTHMNHASGGIAGLGYLGVPAAIGWDHPSEAGSTAAHEFGHTWDRRHTPCGNPANVDPAYPYVDAVIGVFGFDLSVERLIQPTEHDVMSYCRPRWTSDYTYTRVMQFREVVQPTSAVSAIRLPAQPSLLVWGRVERGRVRLEPAFLVHTTPVLPRKPGAYRIEGLSRSGSRLFTLSFDPDRVADAPEEIAHFAFAVPLSSTAAAEVAQLRLDGPLGVAEISATSPAAAQPMVGTRARGANGRVELRWDGGASRMAMVRDPANGQVLGFLRGGAAELPTRATRLELHLSNGVSSRVVQLPVEP